MHKQIYSTAYLLAIVLHSGVAMPYAETNDIDDNYLQQTGQRQVDYHTVIGHFKDFLMYLPVVMTTFKETMSGFPRFAEGVRIMTSRTGRADEDCQCKGATSSSNEIENSSRYG